MTSPQAELLAIGAHPDDIEIGCGGTILRLTSSGKRAVAVDLTAGERATFGDPGTRLAEAGRAAARLGLAARENLGFPDGALHAHPEARKPLVEAIRRHRPRLVLAPHPEDRHPDHAAAGRLAAEAVFFADVGRYPAAGERHRVSLLLFYMIHLPFEADLVVDVTSVLEEKLAALRAYRSQLYDPRRTDRPTNVGAPDYLERLKARLRYYGEAAGCTFGEPFACRGPVPVRNVECLL